MRDGQSKGTMIVEKEADVYLCKEKDKTKKARHRRSRHARSPSPARAAASRRWKRRAPGAAAAAARRSARPPATSAWDSAVRGYRTEMEHFAYCVRQWQELKQPVSYEKKDGKLSPRRHHAALPRRGRDGRRDPRADREHGDGRASSGSCSRTPGSTPTARRARDQAREEGVRSDHEARGTKATSETNRSTPSLSLRAFAYFGRQLRDADVAEEQVRGRVVALDRDRPLRGAVALAAGSRSPCRSSVQSTVW